MASSNPAGQRLQMLSDQLHGSSSRKREILACHPNDVVSRSNNQTPPFPAFEDEFLTRDH
jgi:hypothetical protein